MTSNPLSSLYFSNFSCGTASGAGLAAAGFGGACAAVFTGAFPGASAVCARNEFAKASKASKPIDNAFLRRSLIAVSSRCGETRQLGDGRKARMSSVARLLAYLASESVQVLYIFESRRVGPGVSRNSLLTSQT